MRESTAALRELARRQEACDHAAALIDAIAECPDGQMALRVSWHWGSGCDGYRELSAAMTRVVARRWPELAAEALQELRDAEKRAEEDLRAALSAPAAVAQ